MAKMAIQLEFREGSFYADQKSRLKSNEVRERKIRSTLVN